VSHEPHPPRDTKEFVAGWQTIVEEHVVSDLAAALRKLAAAESAAPEILARHLAHALQVAAGPTGSVQAAVQYLGEVAENLKRPGPP
jgi:hypothetical protein